MGNARVACIWCQLFVDGHDPVASCVGAGPGLACGGHFLYSVFKMNMFVLMSKFLLDKSNSVV